MLKTEMRNKATKHIDTMSTRDMVEIIQKENINSVNAINSELENIAKVIDNISERMKKGGRLFYVGCGTSGRLGVLDASECPPTYGVSSDLVVGIIAGGDYALRNATEGTEDNFELGVSDLEKYNINKNDSVIGISAAGGAKYVLGAFDHAKRKGAFTACITSNKDTPLEKASDIAICPDTAAEVVTGSTRMKAGTAQKMILNMISTSVMIKQGYVYENLMINLKPSNEKLKNRMISIVKDITATDEKTALELLESNDFVIRKAIESYENRSRG